MQRVVWAKGVGSFGSKEALNGIVKNGYSTMSKVTSNIG
jgi:hypothetical protein